MAHIRIGRNNLVYERTLAGWQSYLADKLSAMQFWHDFGGRFFAAGVVFLTLAVLFQL